jgi:endogenous inhibitor of DNA gyrase (YacG/DUF329 family)
MPKGVHLPRVELDCATCSKRFSRVGSDTNRRYCSRECARRHAVPIPERLCEACGSPFTPSRERAARFCSQGCHLRLLAQRRSARSGIFGTTKKAKATLLRELGRCERCSYNAVPGILELHHHDRNPRHNHRENVILLCPNCHSLDHFLAGDGQFKSNLGRVAGPPQTA